MVSGSADASQKAVLLTTPGVVDRMTQLTINTAGQEVSPPPGVRFSVPANQVSSPKPKGPALYDGKSSCRDYLVQFEMVSDLNRWDENTRAL